MNEIGVVNTQQDMKSNSSFLMLVSSPPPRNDWLQSHTKNNGSSMMMTTTFSKELFLHACFPQQETNTETGDFMAVKGM